MNQKIFVLTWIYGGKVTEIKESPLAQLIQREKSKLQKEPQYKKG